jgi:OmpA-OmpF porin, OOP family
MRLTKFARFFITAVITLVVGLTLYHHRTKLFPEAAIRASVIPSRVDLGSSPAAVRPTAIEYRRPARTPGCDSKPEVRMNLWAWNSQLGLMAANGGKRATAGSLMCEAGVNLALIREDDPTRMQENLAAFAEELARGVPNPRKGTHFVAIMGDGSAAFLQGLNAIIEKKLGAAYRARIVGSCGYSRGEDKFMGPVEWKQNPASSRGGVVAGYLRDGDWNIAQKWLGDNGLRNNPDEKTWDPDALNWVAAESYTDAAKKYVEGWSEVRPVVRNGRRTGESRTITVQGVVTWTPGDVTVARERGGLVSIVSTKEYSSQMPNVIIGIDRWMKDNSPVVEGMLAAIFRGGDAVKQNPNALQHAAAVSAEVYAEADAAYWLRYYEVVMERDKQGLEVELGGSYVNNLADNVLLFGLVPGSADLLEATYTRFADIVVQQYPDLMPSYPPMESVRDLSYIRHLAEKEGLTSRESVAEVSPRFEPASASTGVISRRSWRITFETGSPDFDRAAESELEALARDLLVASAARIQIHGHTDSIGSPDSNQRLSEERAFAVRAWLIEKSPINFPAERLAVFAHGQTNPLASNSSEEGRASNRRVEIVLTAE